MKDLTRLSATQFEAELKKRMAASSAATKALCNAGFRDERSSETRQRAAETGEALAVEYVRAADAEADAFREEKRRLRYSGTLKPITKDR